MTDKKVEIVTEIRDFLQFYIEAQQKSRPEFQNDDVLDELMGNIEDTKHFNDAYESPYVELFDAYISSAKGFSHADMLTSMVLMRDMYNKLLEYFEFYQKNSTKNIK